MNADEFLRHVQGQLSKAQQSFDEIAQAQSEFQGAYVRFKGMHDKLLNELVDGRGGSLPEPLAVQAAARLPAEEQAVAARIKELDELWARRQGEADAKVAAMQAAAAGLRALNPQLNDREESVKAMIAFRQQRLNDLNAKVQKLGGGLGFVLRAGKIRDLDNERHKLVGRLEELNKQLAEVRQQWKEKHDAVAADQAEMKTEWASITVQAGSLKAERDALAADPAGQARRRAVLYVLDNLKELQGADDELKRMIDLNIQTDNYHAALGSVAGLLGVLKGIHEGLERFGGSVSAIAEEQSLHSAHLKALNLSLPPQVVAFEKVWEELLPKVRDEKECAAHPAEFVAAMRPFVEQRFTPAIIGGYFEALGKTIKAATSGWRG